MGLIWGGMAAILGLILGSNGGHFGADLGSIPEVLGLLVKLWSFWGQFWGQSLNPSSFGANLGSNGGHFGADLGSIPAVLGLLVKLWPFWG